MKLHHIGIATKDVFAIASLLQLLGYKPGKVQYDQNQNVGVMFLYSDTSTAIELLFKDGDTASPIDNVIKKNDTSVYHLCYETDNLEQTVSLMRKNGYLPVTSKKKSLINNSDVIFLYHTDSVLIELVET